MIRGVPTQRRAVAGVALVLLAVSMIVLPAAVSAQASEAISKADVDGAVKAAKAALADTAPVSGFSGAAKVLAAAKADGSKYCSTVTRAAATAETLSAAFSAVTAAATLGCPDAGRTVSDAAKAAVKAALTSGDLAQLYFATGIAAALPTGAVKVDVPAVASAVVDLMEDDFTFRSSAKDNEPSVLKAAWAYNTLAALSNIASINAETKEKLKAVLDGVAVLAGRATHSGNLEVSGASKVAAASLFVTGALNLASAISASTGVAASQWGVFASYLVSQRSTTDMETAGYVLGGLTALANAGDSAPLVVAVATPQVAANGGAGAVTVRVSDVFGKAVTASVNAESGKRRGASMALFKNQALTAGAAGEYTFDLLQHSPAAGVYDLKLVVKAADRSVSVTRAVKVTNSVVVGGLRVFSSSASRARVEDSMAAVQFPARISETVSASTGQHLHVVFDVTDASSKEAVSPHQVFVRLVNTQSKKVATFVAARSSTGPYTVSLDLNKRAQLDTATEAGDYDLQIIVGDATIDTPVVWEVGTVSLKPQAAAPAAPKPLYHEPLLHDSDVALGPLRTFNHQFRQPDRRPAAVVALTFTVLCALPVLIFLVASGGNLRGIPTGAGFLWAVGFHGSLLAVLGLFAVYWIGLTMIQTLIYVTPLGCVTVFFGHRLLRYLAHQSSNAAPTATKTKKDQ